MAFGRRPCRICGVANQKIQRLEHRTALLDARIQAGDEVRERLRGEVEWLRDELKRRQEAVERPTVAGIPWHAAAEYLAPEAETEEEDAVNAAGLQARIREVYEGGWTPPEPDEAVGDIFEEPHGDATA